MRETQQRSLALAEHFRVALRKLLMDPTRCFGFGLLRSSPLSLLAATEIGLTDLIEH